MKTVRTLKDVYETFKKELASSKENEVIRPLNYGQNYQIKIQRNDNERISGVISKAYSNGLVVEIMAVIFEPDKPSCSIVELSEGKRELIELDTPITKFGWDQKFKEGLAALMTLERGSNANDAIFQMFIPDDHYWLAANFSNFVKSENTKFIGRPIGMIFDSERTILHFYDLRDIARNVEGDGGAPLEVIHSIKNPKLEILTLCDEEFATVEDPANEVTLEFMKIDIADTKKMIEQMKKERERYADLFTIDNIDQ